LPGRPASTFLIFATVILFFRLPLPEIADEAVKNENFQAGGTALYLPLKEH
jgi:hypothetical protein